MYILIIQYTFLIIKKKYVRFTSYKIKFINIKPIDPALFYIFLVKDIESQFKNISKLAVCFGRFDKIFIPLDKNPYLGLEFLFVEQVRRKKPVFDKIPPFDYRCPDLFPQRPVQAGQWCRFLFQQKIMHRDLSLT